MKDMKWLSVQETADFLKVHPDTIRRNLDEIPHVRIGRQIRISREKLIDWLNFQKEDE